MFDSKEIARRALLRAEEISVEKKRMSRRWKSAGALLGTCAVAAAIMIAVFPGINQSSYINLLDEPLPLAALLLPDENAKPLTGTVFNNDFNFKIPGFDSYTVPAGVCEIKMVLFNPEENQCSFTFEIILQETEESLFMSGLIAPDMFIEDLVLSRPLEQGQYDAVLKIRAYDPLTQAPQGDSSVYFTLTAASN